VELLIFVTPEFCEAMDPDEVPPCGPSQLTTTPTDLELFGRGYIEVPKSGGGTGGNCGPGGCAPGGMSPAMPNMSPYEQLPPAQMNPGPVPMSGVNSSGGGSKQARPSIAITPDAASRGNPIGTGAKAQPVSTTRVTGTPQGATSQQSSVNTHGLRAAQPTLIGAQGYDELK